jgi:hypothetical protein
VHLSGMPCTCRGYDNTATGSPMILLKNLVCLQIVELVKPLAYCPACTYSSLYIVLKSPPHTVAVYHARNQLSCLKNECV